MPWVWPLKNCAPLIPDGPGEFGASRKFDVHTGVDLYCELGTEVVAVEGGRVVAVEWFTGKNVAGPDGKPADHWNDTQVVMVEGASGIVAYGEISAHVSRGDVVLAGQVVGVVDVAVLQYFKGRPMVMLHLELYLRLVEDTPSWVPSHTAWWALDASQPEHLLDPTPHLCHSHPRRFEISCYDGTSFRDPKAPSKSSPWWAVWGGSSPR